MSEKTYPDEKPKYRAECHDMPRPCPFVSCRYHLQLDVSKHGFKGKKTGLLVQLRSDPSTWTAETKTCALDIADAGPTALKAIAAATTGKGRGEYERQIMAEALLKLRAEPDAQDLAEIIGLDPDTTAPVLTTSALIDFEDTMDLLHATKPKHGSDPDFPTFDQVSRAYRRNPIRVAPIKTIAITEEYVNEVLRAIRKKQPDPPRSTFVPRKRRTKMVEELPKTQAKERPHIEWI